MSKQIRPAVRSAQRAIARALPHLPAHAVFALAALAEYVAYGRDRGHWGLSAEQAHDLDPDIATRVSQSIRSIDDDLTDGAR